MKNLFAIACTALVLMSGTELRADQKITLDVCKADYEAMLAEAERNREQSVSQLEFELRSTSDPDVAGDLNQQLEQTWELEEMFRNLAATAYRDCVKYVNSGGS